MKDSLLWGIVLLVVGGVLMLNALGVADVNGWWALFIIVPCAISLLFDRNHSKWAWVGLILGTIQLLGTNDLLPSIHIPAKVIFPSVVLVAGAWLLSKGMKK